MADKPKPPALDSFKAALMKGNMPDGYPAEALAAFALDLRAAEAFVKTPEGAQALGLLRVGDSTPFNGDEAWASLTFERRLALATTLCGYADAFEPEAPQRKITAKDLIVSQMGLGKPRM